MGEDTKTKLRLGETRVEVQGIQEVGLEEVQEGWERCREAAESKESWGNVQGGFQKCREREAKRQDRLQAEVQRG